MKPLRLIAALAAAVALTAVGLWAYGRAVVRRAEGWIDAHYAAIGSGEIDRAMSHFAPEFFERPKADQAGRRASLARLGAPQQRSLYNSHAGLRRGARGLSLYVDLGYQTSYGANGSFQEDFELVRAQEGGGFVILRHDYD